MNSSSFAWAAAALVVACAGGAPRTPTSEALPPAASAGARAAAPESPAQVASPVPLVPSEPVKVPLSSGRAGRAAFVMDREAWFRVVEPPAPVAPRPPAGFRLLKQIPVGQSHLTTAQFFPDERRILAVSEADAKLRVYDLEGKLLSIAPISDYEKFGRADFLVWPFAGSNAKVVHAAEHSLRLLDAANGAVLAVLAELGAWRLRLATGLLGASSFDLEAQKSTLTLFTMREPAALELVARFEFDERADDFVLSADRRRLGVVYYPSGEIEWLDLESPRLLFSAKAPSYAHTLDLSPDGTRLAVGGSELRLFDVNDPVRRAGFAGFDNNIHRVRFAPAGDLVFASSYDGHIRVLSADLEKPVLDLEKTLRHRGTANVYALDFTKSGELLLSSSGDRSLRIWGRGPLPAP